MFVRGGCKSRWALALFDTHVYYSQPVWQFFKTDEIFSQLKKGIYKAVGEFHLFEPLLSLMLQVKKFVQLVVKYNIYSQIYFDALPVAELVEQHPKLKIL